ncbi:hypothetical protein [Chryseobacterium aquaticum]|uniref:hypothetical protein n=1 Tax=Chryseobacterium aquaticum TaxID=452084 RepID=UPI002FC9AFE7
MKQILQIVILLIIFSCNKIEVSKTEVEAVDKVLQFYDGQVNHSIGFKIANGKKANYFELQVSKSDLLNNEQKYLTEQAGNIAYIFYTNLKDEKSNYNEIRVKIDLDNGTSQEYNFSTTELKEIEELYPEIEKTNNFIRDADYKSLIRDADYKSLATQNGEIGVTENSLKNVFDQRKSEFGNIKQIQNQGFSFHKSEYRGDFINVKEVILFDKNAEDMILSYDRKTKKLIAIH